MFEVFGYLGAVFIGVTLGITGGGGSILTVPLLVYLFHVSPVTATAYSLFIVGLTSLIGSTTYMNKKLVSFITAVVFAVPAFTTVYITRKFIVPAIPEEIFSLGSLDVSKDMFIMILFAVLMLGASYSMIRPSEKKDNKNAELNFNYPMIILEGIVVGFLTGLVGAGGGFLIIPALVILANLPMKMAVGTSLLIIAVNSLIGFLGDMSAHVVMNWELLASISVLAIIGILIGSYLSKFISGAKLKPAFGWFVLVMGVYIIGREILIKI
jgi:hypothetical protein